MSRQASNLRRFSAGETASSAAAMSCPGPTNFATVEELCEYYQSVISSVAQHAAELRRFSALAGQMEKGDESAFRNLRSLHDSVEELEDQLSSLEAELSHLEQETGELEEIAKVADQQCEILQLLKSTMKVVEKVPKAMRAPTIKKTPIRSFGMDSVLGSGPGSGSSSLLVSSARTASPHGQARSGHAGATTSNASGPRSPFVLGRVTEDDLKRVSRTVRGQISLSAINDALEEVQTFATRKAAREAREERAKSKIYKHHTPSRLPHGRQKQEPRNQSQSSWEAGDSAMVFTEQELRQACAFFRSGESTARSLLLILCGANRLTQVRGGKNGLVYYQLPHPQSAATS